MIKTKKLNSSKEVRDFFTKKKINDGVIVFKGGYGVVIDKVVKEIFVDKDAKKNANKRLKELK